MKDCHVHSSFSADSSAPMEEMILAGIAAGLSDMYFTEHTDFAHPNMEFQVDMDEYLRAVAYYRGKYSSRIRIHAGIELGIEPRNLEESLAFYREYGKSVEWWIGSCHVFDGADPYDHDFFSEMPARQVYDDYFQGVLYTVQHFPYADAYAHLDYVMRYDPHDEKYSVSDHLPVLDRILTAVLDHGAALELNTGAYRKGFAQPHPVWEVVERYIALGGKRVSVGSDAHAPREVACRFEQVGRTMNRLGLVLI